MNINQFGDLFRWMLEVRIHDDEDVAPRRAESRDHRGREAGLPRASHDAHGVARGKSLRDVRGAVG